MTPIYFMLPVITLLLILGWRSIWQAITKLEDENNVLKYCQNVLMHELKNRRNKGTEKDGYQILNAYDCDYTRGFELINSKLEGKTDGLYYVAERLDAIISAVRKTNRVRMAPSLTDLHNLTMQSEQGKKSTSLFRAITPSVLVLGIFGTLWGVHHFLKMVNEVHQDAINQLSQALLPGGGAVLVTIVLIILREYYNKRLSSFIKELDNYTITDLLPFFQPQDTLVEVADRFVSSLKSTFTGEVQKDLGGLVTELKRYSELFVNKIPLYIGIINHACKNDIDGLTRVAEQMEVCQETMTGIFRETEKKLARLENLAVRYAKDAEEGMVIWELSLNRLMANYNQFCTYRTKNVRLLKRWEIVRKTYEKIIRVSFEEAGTSIREHSAQIRRHEDFLKEMREKLCKCLGESQQIRERSDNLRQNANYTQNKLSELPETSGLLDNCRQIGAQVGNLIEKNRELRQKVVKIKNDITGIQGASKSARTWHGIRWALRDKLDKIRFFPFRKHPVGIILSLLAGILLLVLTTK